MKTDVIYNEECLQGMSERISDNSIDMILADLPYGTTACKWDSVISLEPLWEQYKRIVKDDTAIVLTASQPFTTKLIASNVDWFKYYWIWVKPNGTDPFLAKKRPLNNIEEICVFYKNQPTYNPQMKKAERYQRTSNNKEMGHTKAKRGKDYKYDSDMRYPTRTLEFKSPHQIGSNKERENKSNHPTKKPVALFEYLIKTYTDTDDIVLDNVIGSGTTSVACKALDRKYIGFEQNDEYYKVAQERVSEVQKELI